MASIKKNQLFFCLVFGVSSLLLAIIGLVINIKTVPLNEAVQSLNKEYIKLEKVNQALKIKLNAELSFEQLDKVASENLSMKAPKKIHYLFIQ